ncbi:MAG: hypothetical protein KGQ60_07365 [Planctomycetes bacterium]|nr:hypothetical protein [Planctomycetota bacterium]
MNRSMLLGVKVFCLLLGTNPLAQARNPWSSEVSEARSVQSKTEDIAERLADEFPFSPAVRPAMDLDHMARQLRSLVECGASFGQIQTVLRTTCAASHHVHRLVASDCHARGDRRLVGYFPELTKRMDRLDRELADRYRSLAVPYCPPHGEPVVPVVTVPSLGGPVPYDWHQGSSRFDREAPHESWRIAPEFLERLPVVPSVPSPQLPPGAQIGPIDYRTERAPTPRIGQQLLSSLLSDLLEGI